MSDGRPLVNTDDHRFSDFYYPWDPESPAGVYEIGIAAEVLSKIEEIAAEWGRRSSKNEPQRFRAAMCDCQVANDLAAALVSAGVHCRTEGQLVDRLGAEPRSGYLTMSGAVFPHLWVVIGPRQLIFDPTASQFRQGGACDTGNPEAKGPISLDRYIVDRRLFVDVRSRE